MSCETYIDLILDSLDGVLSENAERELTAHLETCESCRGLYEAYHNIDAVVSSLEEPPEGLKESVLKAIAKEKTVKKRKNVKRYRFTAIAACAAIAVMVAGYSLPSFVGNKADMAGVAIVYDTADEETAVTAAGVLEVPQTMEEMGKAVAAYDGGGASEAVYVELSEAGYSGRLLIVSAEQEPLIAENDQIVLPSGITVYCLSVNELADIQEKLGSYEELLLPGEDSGDIYVMMQ